MERQLVMTGIGGQGIQLASSVLASAALAEGFDVQLFGSYGGMMRGGATEASIVIGDGPIDSPPTLSASWSAILMHHEYSDHARACLGSGSVAFVNTTVVELELDRHELAVVEVPATDIAIDVGNAMAASIVMIGAYAAATAIVGVDSLISAVRSALPSYRKQHIELNERAIAAGATAAAALVAPAWATKVTT